LHGRGNLCPDAKGEIKWEVPIRMRVTEAERRGGATRIRAEGSVMELDRRGCVVQLWPGVNQQWEEPLG